MVWLLNPPPRLSVNAAVIKYLKRSPFWELLGTPQSPMLGLQKYTEDNSPFSNISLLFVAFVFWA